MLTRKRKKKRKSLNKIIKIILLNEETFISMVLKEVKNLEKIWKSIGGKKKVFKIILLCGPIKMKVNFLNRNTYF